ncbi:MAG: hypothetical protein IPM54_06970 [Polyangiaceae bacterium]|nr:hypothetical protein [Polyangiaceae bacterium]
MHSSRWSLAGLLCTALLIGSSPAHGQTAQANAEKLFNEAVELSEARKFEAACLLLAESQKLDPTPGTLFALADCERVINKIASSVTHFKEYLSQYAALKPAVRRRHDQRATLTKGYLAELEPKVPTLKLTFPGGAPEGVVVTRNGVEVEPTALDTDVPLDPGEQVIVVKVPGRQDAEERITVAAGDKKVVELSAGALVIETPVDDGKRASNPRKTAGIVLLGVGAAGLAFGGVMGGLAVGQKGIVDEHCNGLDCDQVGMDAVSSGRTFGNASTIGLAAGTVIAVAGAVLLLTAPKSKPKTAFVTRLGAGAFVGGAFLGVEGEFQ